MRLRQLEKEYTNVQNFEITQKETSGDYEYKGLAETLKEADPDQNKPQ